ncbi:hypothetical protein [Serratia sp. JSRIV004]|uniref:hypothetical protein n=1 Tax=Serratia sp. JSRIV004 TaxID=2831895 RepID=UPI001CBBBB46|nr:hypothetical protein [Serratia sp. JSRIV004]UAN57414.1 hypothetical protein KGP21_28155 [Serratia sp. JSRIV004]
MTALLCDFFLSVWLLHLLIREHEKVWGNHRMSLLHILAQREHSFWGNVNAYSGGKYHDFAPWPESLFILPESVFTRPELPFTPPELFLTH